MHRKFPNLTLFLMFAVLTGIAGWASLWQEWLFMPPCSVHQWRQADGAAHAWNYYINPDFFSPEIQNLQTKGDSHALGELPLTYWIAGLISRITGYKVWILRWVSLFFFLSGIGLFGRMTLKITNSFFRAGIVTGALLISPFLMYYAPGYLPDTPALGMILIAVALGFEGIEKENKILISIAFAFAAVSAMTKLTFLLVPFTCLGGLMGLYFFPESGRDTPKQDFLYRNRLFFLSGFFFLVLAVVAFRIWVSQYNQSHGSIYYLAGTRPVWNYTLPEIKGILRGVYYMTNSYASAGLYGLFVLSVLAIIRFRKQIPGMLSAVMLIHALGVLCIFLLWFRMFREHDYYVTCMMTFPLLIILIAAIYTPEAFLQKNRLIKGLLLLLLVFGLYQTRREISNRLKNEPVYHSYLKDTRILMEMQEDWLTRKGFPENARFLCPEDMSPNTLLLGLKRKGYTFSNFGDRINRDTLDKYQHYHQMNYLVLTDSSLYSPLYREYFPVQLLEIKGLLRIYGKN